MTGNTASQMVENLLQSLEALLSEDFVEADCCRASRHMKSRDDSAKADNLLMISPSGSSSVKIFEVVERWVVVDVPVGRRINKDGIDLRCV